MPAGANMLCAAAVSDANHCPSVDGKQNGLDTSFVACCVSHIHGEHPQQADGLTYLLHKRKVCWS